MTRRTYLKNSAAAIASLTPFAPLALAAQPKLFFKIALGEYSFNTAYRQGKYNPLDLASLTLKTFQLGAIDYVSSFWADKAHDRRFLSELKARAADNHIDNHLILVDLPGPQLGDELASRRAAAIDAHRPWLEVASFLGCSGIRVNLNGFGKPGPKREALQYAVDGYRKLIEDGARSNLDVLVQNHIGYSCDPDWLVEVMKQVNNKHAGIEADPGHFEEIFIMPKPGGGNQVERSQSFDLYSGWAKLMPFTKAVNAKTHSFDSEGNETKFNYSRLLKTLKEAGYRGYIGIEWEPQGTGKQLSPTEGIRMTKALLERNGTTES